LHWQLTLPSALLYTASILAGFSAVFAWRRRKMLGGVAFFLTLLAVTEWTVATATEAAMLRLEDKILW